jgi:hypothetical protein
MLRKFQHMAASRTSEGQSENEKGKERKCGNVAERFSSSACTAKMLPSPTLPEMGDLLSKQIR